jgi:phosphatidylinositol-3-phosphatase
MTAGRARFRAAAVLAVAALTLTACGRGSSSAPPATAPPATAPPSTAPAASASAPPAAPAHVVVVIFENKAYDQVVGHAPAFDALAATGTALTDSRAVAHPSQPNYLALFSGSTQGVTSDSCPHTFAADNLAHQLIAAGGSFTGYAEALPYPGFAGCSHGRYARKHAPWTNFSDLPGTVGQPFTAFPADYGRLPSVSFVIPDLCDDMHDCPVRTGDAWLRDHVAPYAAWARTHRSLLIVTFDEDNGAAGNHIPTLLVGDGVPVGTAGTRVDQYAVLRSLEDCFGLPPLGRAADARPIPHLCPR